MSIEARADSYEWINGEEYTGLRISGFSTIFAVNGDQTSVQKTLGLQTPVDEASMLTPGGPFLVSVYANQAGVIVFERGGYAGAILPVMETLSANAVVAAVSSTFEGDIIFAYAEQGEVLSTFNIDDPASRRGRSPDAVAAHIADLNFPTFPDDVEEDEDEDIYSEEYAKRQIALGCALALGTRLTGLWLTEGHLATVLPRYSSSSLYSASGAAAPLV
jgi:hypothetical protein